MKKNLQLIKNFHQEKTTLISLHDDILDILFENRKFMKNIFQTINGLHEIHHFGLTIIDPLNKLITFSTTPSIEYNLINQNLWSYDPAFLKNPLKPNSIIWWDELLSSDKADQIKLIKLLNNGYTLGISIGQQLNDFTIIYSFATKSPDKNLKEYYIENLSGLIEVGNYCYKSVREIYLQYCEHQVPPKIQSLISKIYHTKSKQHLKLIVSN